MARAIDKRIMLDLIIEAKKTDPETGPFSEWLAEYLVDHLPTLTPPNDLLTLDELRKMDGQPVWIKQLKDLSVCDTGWALIDTCTDRIRVWWPGSEVEDEPSEEYYGKTWVAYGRPPERQEDNNETD